jgi:hypothetical protein
MANIKSDEKYIANPEVKLGVWGILANFFNPLMVIGLIFLGPPGWILMWLHSIACDKMKAKVEELANQAKALADNGRSKEALLYLRAIIENCLRVTTEEQMHRIRQRTWSSCKEVEPPFSALKDEDWYVRREAITALRMIKDNRAVEPLTAALKDKIQLIRCEAAEALGDLKNTEATPFLISALKDEDRFVRKDAAEALNKITEQDFGERYDSWTQWWRNQKEKQ